MGLGWGGPEAQKASNETSNGQVGLQRESREVSDAQSWNQHDNPNCLFIANSAVSGLEIWGPKRWNDAAKV